MDQSHLPGNNSQRCFFRIVRCIIGVLGGKGWLFGQMDIPRFEVYQTDAKVEIVSNTGCASCWQMIESKRIHN